jgi:hypothetical protein
MLVAIKILLQIAARNIGQLTDIEPSSAPLFQIRPPGPGERRTTSVAGRLSCAGFRQRPFGQIDIKPTYRNRPLDPGRLLSTS